MQKSIRKIFDYLRLMRLQNGLLAAFALLITFFVATNSFSLDIVFLPASLAVIFAMGGGNAINDYFDIEIDKLHKSNRPIPSGRLSKKHALYFSLILFFLAIVLAVIYLNMAAILIAIFWSVSFIIYAKYSKYISIFKDVAIAFFSGLLFIYGGLVVSNINLGVLILTLSFTALTLSRDIMKDLEDLEADRVVGAVTLPVQIGERKTKIISFISFIFAPILIFYLLYIESYSISFLTIMTVFGILFAYAFTFKPAKAQMLMKISMIIFFTAFLFR